MALSPPPAPVAVPLPPADPFEDLTEAPTGPVRVHHRNQTRAAEAARTGFGDGFGRTLGQFAANCLILAVLAAIVLGGAFFWLMSKSR